MTSLVITATPNSNEMAAMKEYVEGAMPIVQKNGGKPAKNLKVTNPVYGEASYQIVSVIDFPTEDAIHAFFGDPAYRDLVKVRQRAFTSFDAVIAEDR